jgi:3-oxoacyl-[acyl-carrier-protein] synthase II
VMVAGGAESAVCRLGIAGFNACRALSTGFNDTPTKASRPYDKDRDGFVMGEGAGVVVLEEYEPPAEDGNGGYRAMEMALKRSGLAAADIDYVNAHGTSTMADGIELGAVERFLGNAVSKTAMSSTKSSIGHLLGAAGAVEAIFCLLAMRDGIVPPTLNLENPDVTTQIDLVPLTAQKREVNVALSNSFGFGGTNAALIVSKV